ncbi:MAG: hypothetical protein LBR44_08550 [Clostridiales Family XIII bacterium]|jgi:hypothetical protein|nr:hypothetical protein [Clostridiales Family XIII bacterium]
MKSMIVLLATVILGIAIAAMVLSFRDSAQGMTDSVKSKLETQLGFDTMQPITQD